MWSNNVIIWMKRPETGLRRDKVKEESVGERMEGVRRSWKRKSNVDNERG